MIWDRLRRIVTENDKDGRSSVKIDDRAAKVLAVDEAGLAEIWTAHLGARLLDGVDRLQKEDVRLEPDAGAVKVRWFTIAPENQKLSAAEREAQAAFAFAACGAAQARVDTARHPMMHKTETLDVIVLVKGKVDLLLDDGEAKALKSGDVIIQRATNHAWVNRGEETALLVAVLISAEA
ncbi:MAG: cupin domain-containing protein [Parvularculaceae bacterium]|nr:cupin domain-containing protein [Parvularculaceae bacterium]